MCGAQTVGPQGDEVPGVVQVGDAAGGLDLHVRRAAGAQQAHIVRRGAAGGKAGGGLDVVRAGVGDALAQGDLFLVGEQAGFDDDL